MREPHAIVQLLLLVAVSVLVPLVAVRIRLPSAVLLILAGLGIGPAGLNLLTDTPAVALLSDLGFLILMFIAGMEIDFDSLRAAGPRALVRPTLAVAGFFVLAGLIGGALGLSSIDRLALVATSVGMPLATLQDTGQARTPLGRQVLLLASFGEFVCIVAIISYELSRRHGFGIELLYQLGKIACLFAGSALLIRWSRAVVWWYPETFRRLVEHHDVAEVGVRVGLLLMFAFVLLSELLGVEAILGAFIAGALVGWVIHGKQVLEAKLSALGQGLFIPIFFIVVGVRFDPRLITARSAKTVAVLAVAAVVVKTVPTLIFGARELGPGLRLAAGTLMAAPLTLVVAIGTIGRRLHMITAAEAANLVLLAIVISCVYPTLFKLELGLWAHRRSDLAGEAAVDRPAPPA